MGLSNQERYSKILWSVKNIENLLSGLKGYSTEKLQKFQGKLWPALLNGDSNSSFWLCGGGFDSDDFSNGGFLCEALSANKPEEEESWFRRDERNYIENNLKLSHILGGINSEKGAVVEIYQWVEHFYYAANRYQDEFSTGMSDIKNLISNLKGELFSIISGDEDYLRGYLLQKILEKCIDVYDDDCPLTKLINKEYLFHHFQLQEAPFHDVKDLMEAWRDIQFTYQRDIPLAKRVFFVLACFGRRIGCPSRQKAIIAALDGVVDSGSLTEVLTWCNEQEEIRKNQQEQSFQNDYKFCQLTYK
jgi:hypothetical protein